METDKDNEINESGIITKVEQQKRIKNRYNVFIDEQFACSVHEDILIKFRLGKGKSIDRKEMSEIAHAEDKQRAYLDAVRLLASRLRTEYELKLRLKQKGYESILITETLERLKREQYLDDRLFAEQLTKQRITSQKKGRNWVKQELKQKGLKPEEITHALDQVDEDTEYRSAFDLAYKKYHNEAGKDALKAKRRVMMFLARRGYSNSIITRVFKEISSPSEYEDVQLMEMDFE